MQGGYNHLQLDNIPVALSSLSQLQQILIVQGLPFMHICNTLKGAQNEFMEL